MPPVELEARVRPSSVFILLSEDAPMDSLLLAVRFLSRIWGGRYFPIIPVPSQGVNSRILQLISRDLPEFVFGIGIDDDAWRAAISDIPVIRGYGRLEEVYVDRFFREPTDEDFVSCQPLLHSQQPGDGRAIICGPSTNDAPLGPYMAVLYGAPALRLRLPGNWPACATRTGEGISTGSELVRQWLQDIARPGMPNGLTWLSAMCGRLDVNISNGWPTGARIVLVDSPADLALCWTLRRTQDHEWPSWCIPVPSHESAEIPTTEALSLWLREARRYGALNPSVTVTSLHAGTADLERVTQSLRDEFGADVIRVRSGRDLLDDLPTVVPAERPRVYSLNVENQTMSWQLPRPSWSTQEERGTWVVEYLRDRRTSRALCELALPHRRSCLDALNAPAPTPHTSNRWLERYGLSPAGITARAYSRDEITHQWLPTAQEVLTALLSEAGIEPCRSELRSLYIAAIELLGGLDRAAESCVGASHAVLSILQTGAKTLDELRNQTRFGNRNIPALQRPDPLAFHGTHLRPAQRTIAEQRFREQQNTQHPTQANLPGLLDHWTERGIVNRSWRLPPCPTCHNDEARWTNELDIQQPVHCPVCGIRVRLPHQIDLGYELNPLLRQSLRRGLAPVVLTARFLDWMTFEGFLWLPAQNVKWRGQEAEIDLVGCGDRRLIFAECKELDDAGPTSPSWDGVWGQFEQLVEMACDCRADLAVLSTFAERFPDGWEKRADNLTAGRIRFLLLTRSELEVGYRRGPRPPGISANSQMAGEIRLHLRDLFERQR